jgi:acyl-CoA reductase-like NAD-dependent aldehyde dehydrogenase
LQWETGVSAHVIEVRNPATLEKIADLPVATPAVVADCVARARNVQAIWQETSFAERSRLLYRLRNFLLDKQDRLADIITSETGQTRAEAYGNELFYLCDAIGLWAKKGPGYLKPEKIRPSFLPLKTKRAVCSYSPFGVVGIISPWNFPLTLTLGEAIPALMAGNAVVIKPSELTPLSALFAADLMAEAGFPQNLLQVAIGRGETGETLIDHVDMIAFTGSVETGKRVMHRAAERLIPVSLELGGKDPLIVLEDADLERAAGACVWGALMNCGQTCTSIERVYVEEPVYEQFVAKVLERVRAIRQGPGEKDVDIGSMTSEVQLRKVEAQVADAVHRGAKILTGGRRNPQLPGFYYEATVLVDVDHSMDVMRDETFGPVIPVMKVKDADEALRLANDCRYGLGGAIFSRDLVNAGRMAKRLQTGAVCINDSLVNFVIPDAPMGGMKESGFGYRHGASGIRKYCRQKTIAIDRFGLKREFHWFPESDRKSRQTRLLLELICRSGWKNKLRALARLARPGLPLNSNRDSTK